MPRPLLAALAAALLLSPAPADDAVRDVEAALKELNAAFETGKADAIARWMTEDHIAVTPWAGRQTRDDQLKSLADLKLTTYEAGKMTFTPLGADGVLISYPLTMKGTFRGKPVPTASHAAAVWARREGKWKELYYQETEATGK